MTRFSKAQNMTDGTAGTSPLRHSNGTTLQKEVLHATVSESFDEIKFQLKFHDFLTHTWKFGKRISLNFSL